MSALPTSSTLMPHRWYIKTSSGKTGPFTVEELQQFADKQKISPVTAITSDGNKWVKAKRVRGLHFASENPSHENAEPPLVPAPKIAAPSKVAFQPFGMKTGPESVGQINGVAPTASKAEEMVLARRKEELARVDQDLSKFAISLDEREEALNRRERELQDRLADEKQQTEIRNAENEQASIQAEELERKKGLLDQQNADLDQREQQIKSQSDELASQQTELETRQKELDEREQALVQRNEELEGLAREQQELETLQTSVQKERDALQERLTELESREQELATREKELQALVDDNGDQEERERLQLELQQRDTELANKEQGLTAKLAEYESREAELQQRVTELIQRDEQAATFETNLAERSTEAATREKVIAEREASLTQREAEATKREAAISERESEQNALDQELKTLEESVKQKVKEFEAVEAQFKSNEQEVIAARAEVEQLGNSFEQREAEINAKSEEILERQQQLDSQLADLEKRQQSVRESEDALAQSVADFEKRQSEFCSREKEHTKRFADLQERAAEVSKAEMLLIERETLISKRETELRRRESVPNFAAEIPTPGAHGLANSQPPTTGPIEAHDAAAEKRKPAALPPRIDDSVDDIDESVSQSTTIAMSSSKTVVMEPFEPMGAAQSASALTRPAEPQDHTELRQQEYDRLFGPPVRVESSPASSIQVSVHPPTPSRSFITLVTNGMSDYQMPTKSSDTARAELIMYVREEDSLYMEIMHSLAQVPKSRDMPMQYGTTLNNGNPPQPIVERSALDGFVFMVPVVEEDFRIKDRVKIDGEPLNLLWVTPTTSSEREVIRRSSLEDFFQLLEKYDHPVVFDPFRKCYSKRKWFSR